MHASILLPVSFNIWMGSYLFAINIFCRLKTIMSAGSASFCTEKLLLVGNAVKSLDAILCPIEI